MVTDDSVVGQRVPFQEPLGILFVLLLPLAAILLVVAVILRQPYAGLAAVWPVCYCVTHVCVRRRPVDILFLDDRLRIEPEGAEARYVSLQGLRLNNGVEPGDQVRARTGTLSIVAADGFVFSGNSDHAGKVYEFLLRQAPACGSRSVNPRLARHLAEQLEPFDDDLVLSYVGRKVIGEGRSPILRVGQTMLLAFAIVSALSAVFSLGAGWAAGLGTWGILLSIVGLLDRAQRTRPAGIKNWEESSLILSPFGIAVVQGDLVGKMKWDEIVKLGRGIPMRSFAISRGPKTAINMTIKGANIMLLDLYDRPLAVIEEKIRAYWEAGQGSDSTTSMSGPATA